MEMMMPLPLMEWVDGTIALRNKNVNDWEFRLMQQSPIML
jgi:hypothetical protein